MDERFVVGFPRPGKALVGAMLAVFVTWLFFALFLNWGAIGRDLFDALVGSDAIFDGQVWRLVTAPLIHHPSGNGATSHMLSTVMGLYFLGAPLERSWGGRRFVLFLLASGALGALLQAIVGVLVPPLHRFVFYGGLGVVDAVAVAWALSFRDQQVRLFFVLPVTGRGLLWFVVGLNVLYAIAFEQKHEGIVTPFGGMLAGWLGSDGSPLRRLYLRLRFRRLQAQSESLRGLRTSSRDVRPKLRVVEGGAGKRDKRTLN
jgi:membrane associated rhomboid family serine protease